VGSTDIVECCEEEDADASREWRLRGLLGTFTSPWFFRNIDNVGIVASLGGGKNN